MSRPFGSPGRAAYVTLSSMPPAQTSLLFTSFMFTMALADGETGECYEMNNIGTFRGVRCEPFG